MKMYLNVLTHDSQLTFERPQRELRELLVKDIGVSFAFRADASRAGIVRG